MLIGRVAIKQVDVITYEIYYQNYDTPGLGIFTVNTQNTFVYSGSSSSSAPTGTTIYPSTFPVIMNEKLSLINLK
jgi:hypothetical protein